MESSVRRDGVDRAYRDHVDDVYRVVYAVVHDVELARDLTHDSFARAFERWEQYDDRRPLRPWLQGIAVHVALDSLRRRRVRWMVLPGGREAIDAAPSHEPWTPDDSERWAQRESLEAGMAELRPIARAALVLRHVYGYEYAEIGSMLGTSPGNVGSLLSRSRASLREHLSADLPRPIPSADPARRAAR